MKREHHSIFSLNGFQLKLLLKKKKKKKKKEPASRYGALFVAIRVGQTKRVALATIFPRTLDGAKEHQHVFHDRRV